MGLFWYKNRIFFEKNFEILDKNKIFFEDYGIVWLIFEILQ